MCREATAHTASGISQPRDHIGGHALAPGTPGAGPGYNPVFITASGIRLQS